MNDRVKKSNEDEEIISEEKLNEIKQSVIEEEKPKDKPSIAESDLDATIAKIKEQKKKEVEQKKRSC